MSRFKNNLEQKKFIEDSNEIFSKLLSQLPVENREGANSIIDEHYNKWNKIFTVQQEKDSDNLQKISIIYKNLKNSVQFGEIDPNVSIKMSTIEECRESLLTLHLKQKSKKCQVRMLQYQAGEVLYNLKMLTKTVNNFKMEIKKLIDYSHSYAYFLINLFEACNKFKNLRYTILSTKILKNNFTDLLKYMENDTEYWNQERNVLTSSMDRD